MNFPGLIDLHVHTAPDVRVRKFTDDGLAAAVLASGARGAVLKSHNSCTAERAWLARARYAGTEIHGSLVLNSSAGGVNPAVVTHAIRMGAKIIWLPTLMAENHRRYEGKTGGEPVVHEGRVTPALAEVLRLAAEADIAVATGHLSADESVIVARVAWALGVKKFLITHPEHPVVAMSVEQQAALLAEGPVIFERCYSHPGGDGHYRLNFEANLQAIETLGTESTVLDSDCGQVENPQWPEVWSEIYRYYLDHHITPAALRHMTCDLPARLLNLPILQSG